MFFLCFSAVLQEVVFREESEKNGLGVAPRSCFGVQGGCFLSSLSEGSALSISLVLLRLKSASKAFWEKQNAHANSCICRALWFNGGGHIDLLLAEKSK